MSGLRKSVDGLKYKPKQLREKKTRALRRALTPAQVRSLMLPFLCMYNSNECTTTAFLSTFRVLQAAKKTLRATTKANNFPLRRYALKA